MASLDLLQQAEKNGEDESEMENNVEMVTSINVLRIKCRDNAIINEF